MKSTPPRGAAPDAPKGTAAPRRTSAQARTPSRTRRPAQPASLEVRLRSCYETLPPSEMAVADVLLNHPGRLTTHSATELAADAGASKAAVTRLIQRLGYASHAAARAEVRDAQQWGSPVYIEPEGAAAGDRERQAALAAHIAADQQLLARTLAALSPADLDAAVQALATARRVVVLGHRNNAWLASNARAHLTLLRPGVELAPQSAETLAESLVGLGADDLVLALGFRRRLPALAAALREAREAKARVLLLTDPSGAADLRSATWTLVCHTRGASMFDSYVAAVSVLNFLATQLAHQLGATGRQRLQEVERWHERLSDLG